MWIDYLGRNGIRFTVAWKCIHSGKPFPHPRNRRSPNSLANSQGFAAGWFYCFGYAVDFPNKAVAFANYMSYWSDKPRALWISIFFVAPILFNALNVRRYGEIEYVLTAIKVTTIVGLIIAGLLIAMEVTGTALLGTDDNLRPVACINNTIGNCLTEPGFGCIP